jgi:hypothetical protein
MADDQGGLLAKSGKDSINIAGHKIPIALIGGVAALAGVILVLRARSQGSNVATVGQAPYTAASTGFGTSSFGPDYSGALANISQELATLQQGVGTSGPATPTPTPAPTTPAQTYQVATANPNFQAPADWPKGLLPLYGVGPNPLLVPSDTALQVVGPSGQWGVPVNYLGTQYLISPSEWDINLWSQHPATFR